jgi:uncharacterized membrane protein YeaQ/YmgE (transglycosylase-associated protein family)
MLNTLLLFVSDLQRGSLISFAAWILLGGLIGFIGSKIVNKSGHGLVRDILLSVFGAIFGGFLANLLGERQTASVDRYSLLVAAVGAVVFLITYLGVFRRRGFLVWPRHHHRDDSVERREASPKPTTNNSHI